MCWVYVLGLYVYCEPKAADRNSRATILETRFRVAICVPHRDRSAGIATLQPEKLLKCRCVAIEEQQGSKWIQPSPEISAPSTERGGHPLSPCSL
jgi:hypothetical protein